jgi:hypothetical protein
MTNKAAQREREFRFPVMQRVLTTYFPGPDHEEDHSAEFVLRYKRFGEETIEFRGLKTELEGAINHHPKVAALEVNLALGTKLPDAEVRKHLISLYDQLNGLGAFDRERIRAQRPDSHQLLRAYFFVPVRLPQAFARRMRLTRPVPLGAVFVGGMALLGVMSLIYRVVPSVLRPVANIVAVVALLGVAVSAYAMYHLRRAALHPEKQADEELERVRSKRDHAAPIVRSRWARWTRFRA